MNETIIKVFLVDDHQVLLDGLKLLLKGADRIQIVGTACNGQDLLQQLAGIKHEPEKVDVILMDANMNIMNGYEATQKVKNTYPEIKVIMLTRSDQQEDIDKAIIYGADGFLSKQNGKTEIVDAIFRVYQSQEFVIYTVLDYPNSPTTEPKTEKEPNKLFLTEREKQIVRLICQEYDIDGIALLLSLSPITVAVIRKNILSKLKVNSDAGIVREALTQGLCNEIGFNKNTKNPAS